MSADAFYTSPIGIRDVGYQGNAYRNRYRVPQEAIDHVMSRRGPGSTRTISRTEGQYFGDIMAPVGNPRNRLRVLLGCF
jgi:hypothetical protein